MRTENKFTLRRFFDANHIHGAVNVAGVVGSLHQHTAAMLDAGWGTDQINDDPAVRYIVWGLARLCGLTVDDDQWIATHSALNGERSKLEKAGHKIP